MNKVFLCGRFTKDPAIYGDEKNKTARFSIAVNRMKVGADFPSIVAFKKTAEIVERYCKKGTQVNVEGHIQTGSYEGKDGKKVYTQDIIADHIEFVGAKNNDNLYKPEEGFTAVTDDFEGDNLPFN